MTLPCGGVFGSTKTGLQARWGSDFDLHIPRPPKSKTALPESVRKQMGLKERRSILSASTTLKDEKNVRNKVKGAYSYTIKKRDYLKKGAGVDIMIGKNVSLAVHRCDIA